MARQVTEREETFLAFLNAIDCLPRHPRPESEKMKFLLNWTALVLARCFDVQNNVESDELRRKMEAFVSPFINTGYKK
jgi:hypothetical protein